MTLLLFEPRLCTKHELETIYSTSDLYDFLEIIEAKQALDEEAMKQAEKT